MKPDNTYHKTIGGANVSLTMFIVQAIHERRLRRFRKLRRLATVRAWARWLLPFPRVPAGRHPKQAPCIFEDVRWVKTAPCDRDETRR